MVDQLSKLAHNGLLFQIIGESWSSIIPFKQKYRFQPVLQKSTLFQPSSTTFSPPFHHLFTTWIHNGSDPRACKLPTATAFSSCSRRICRRWIASGSNLPTSSVCIYIYNDEFYYYYYYESYYLIVVNVIIACDIVILLWSLSLLLLLYIIYTTRMGNRHSSVCGYAYIYYVSYTYI